MRMFLWGMGICSEGGGGGGGYAGGAHCENCMVFEKTYFATFHAAHFGSMNGVQSTSCIARLN